MDRAALARELFDIHQAGREQVQVLLLSPDVTARAAGRQLKVLIDRAEKVIEGYVASADSGRINVRG